MKTGAQLVVEALEKEGVRYTFGIPGTHNTELYDALAQSTITPILVTNEQGASFMADAISRTTNSIGVCNLVPGAGLTHALSGIAEAYMDSVPLIVLTCGIRTDTGKQFQLHAINQLGVVAPVCKATYAIKKHEDIFPIFTEAFELARSGEPGPVAIEVPVNIYLFKGTSTHVSNFKIPAPTVPDVSEAVSLLTKSKNPILYVGWGARNATQEVKELAETLQAPVVTTFQGIGILPYSHPLHLWHTLGKSSPSFAQKIYKQTDCMLAVGCKFGEVATASYGFEPPSNLIHIDINEKVLNANYPAKAALAGDAKNILQKILEKKNDLTKNKKEELANTIQKGKKDFRSSYRSEKKDKVSPLAFFENLRLLLPYNSIIVCDSGNHTFLTAEMMPFEQPSTFLGPMDYSCMGFGVPAAIGAKLANRGKKVVGVVGDGGFLMTGLELITASQNQIGVIICVFSDTELGQIAQFQEVPYKHKTATKLYPYKLRGIAEAVGAAYLHIDNNHLIGPVLRHALEEAERNLPVIVDVKIDYSQKTQFTKGVVKTNLNRFPFKDRMRFITRAIGRRLK